jgi:DNA-binding NarL/FixJ family response regulator
MTLTCQILIVDDHPLFRSALAAALDAAADLEVIAAVGTAREAIELATRVAIDLATVDVLMPAISGVDLADELYALQPSCKVLIVSAIDEPELIADVLRSRACGFAIKSQSSSEIVGAVRQVLSGARYIAPSVSHGAIDAAMATIGERPLGRLTRREREIFELLVRGNSNDEIGSRLFISRRTVETHRQRVMNKLSAHSITKMQRIAARFGGFAT